MSDVSTPERITADTWANLQEWARGMAQRAAGANSDVPELSPAEAEKQARRGDLLAYGFPEKYASGVDPSVGLEHAASEAALQRWMARLPEMIRDGGHLILCGGVGIGKSYACARIAEFMRQLPGNRPWYPSEISFRFAPDLAGDLLDWDAQRQSWPAAVVMIMRAVLLIVDDVDRWLTLDQYDRNRARLLYQWDALMERRDCAGRVTVVTANRPEHDVPGKPGSGLQAVPEFRRWLSRAHGRGDVLTIPGADRRATR